MNLPHQNLLQQKCSCGIEPFAEVSAGKAFTIHAKVVGIDTGRVTLQISRFGNGGPGGGLRTFQWY